MLLQNCGGENPQDTAKMTEIEEIEINSETNRRIWNLFK